MMKCSIQGCPGEYEAKLIVHMVKRGDDVLVFENVPAEVCNICSDTLLTPETLRNFERLVQTETKPEKYIPLYEYTQESRIA